MDTDPLDDLLSRSAPPDRAHLSADKLRSMSVAARTQARTDARPARHGWRRLHWGIAAGITGTLLIGGGGAAVATGLISWEPEYQNPDTAFTFSLPSGRTCEARLVAQGGWGEQGPDQAAGEKTKQQLRSWLKKTDVLAQLDMDAGWKIVDQAAKDSSTTTVVIGSDGWLEDVSESPSTQTDDDRYAFAIEQALRVLANEHMNAQAPVEAWSADGGVKCELAVR